MDSNTLFIIKAICATLATLTGILAAWFTYRDLERKPEEQEKVTQWYAEKWNAIQDSGVLELPEIAIQWLISAKNNLPRTWRQISDYAMSHFTFLLNPIISIVGTVYFFGWLPMLALAIFPVVNLLTEIFPKKNHRKRYIIRNLLDYLYLVVWSTLPFLIFVLTVLKLPLSYAVVFAVIALPIIIVSFAGSTVFTPSSTLENVGPMMPGPGYDEEAGLTEITGLSAAISIPITLIAFIVGHYAAPDAWIPHTLQMLISNISHDAMTMFVTILILGGAIGERRSYSIPTAIILDLVAAATLACASLWFGLLLSEHELGVWEVWHILWGNAADGSRVELGPYFWAMHTAFLPTLAYLFIIAFCWLAKLIVLPIARVLRRAARIERPHTLTAAALALVTVILFAVSAGIGYMEDLAAAKEAAEQQPISQERTRSESGH